MLQEKDRKTLISAYTWPDTDDFTKHLKNDANALLAILVAKETIKKGGEIPLGKLVTLSYVGYKHLSLHFSSPEPVRLRGELKKDSSRDGVRPSVHTFIHQYL